MTRTLAGRFSHWNQFRRKARGNVEPKRGMENVPRRAGLCSLLRPLAAARLEWRIFSPTSHELAILRFLGIGIVAEALGGSEDWQSTHASILYVRRLSLVNVSMKTEAQKLSSSEPSHSAVMRGKHMVLLISVICDNSAFANRTLQGLLLILLRCHSMACGLQGRRKPSLSF